MNIILRADVENLGKVGDVVSVRAGYGRNYLLPQGLAMIASPGNLKAFELERKKLEAKMSTLRTDAQSVCERLENLEIIIKMRVGENDKLYGSVTSTLIQETLASLGVEVDRRRILLDAPIRLLGDHEVRVRLFAGVIANIVVKVQSEQVAYAEDDVVEQAPEVSEETTEETAAEEATEEA